MITSSYVQAAVLFAEFQAGLAADAYNTGCQLCDWDIQDDDVDSFYEVHSGLSALMENHAYRSEHELEMDAFMKEVNADYRADMDYDYAEMELNPPLDDLPF